MRKNHFNSMSNDQLKECYQSYKRLTDEGSEKPELFNTMKLLYQTTNIMDENTAYAYCKLDMYDEIAKRYFTAYDSIYNRVNAIFNEEDFKEVKNI